MRLWQYKVDSNQFATQKQTVVDVKRTVLICTNALRLKTLVNRRRIENTS